MIVYIYGITLTYELEHVARMFAGVSSVELTQPPADIEGDFVYLYKTDNCEVSELGCSASYGGMSCEKRESKSTKITEKEAEFFLSAMLFDILHKLTGFCPPWGVITGIRPAKFAGQLLKEKSSEQVEELLHKDYRVSEKKASLCVKTALKSDEIAHFNSEKSYSLYVSIPFCPSRCSYCSFVSQSIEKETNLVQPYLEKLCLELVETAKITKELELKLESVYIGGGTPTVLSAEQLEQLCATIAQNFPLEQSREYSVEAGRPDTITEKKLTVLKQAGVTRISINPQTSNESVLKGIGRNHSARDVEQSFEWARKAGFDNINADLIAGLPEDSLESFEKSLRWLVGINPENITVHALTLKRASTMTKNNDKACNDASKMVEFSYKMLSDCGYSPYYMYKQKGTIDSLENTGYAKPGKACLYNIYIMDELHTIIACGAGAVTKLKNQKNGLITRIFNYKYPKQYIDGFDVMLERRKGISEFYEI